MPRTNAARARAPKPSRASLAPPAPARPAVQDGTLDAYSDPRRVLDPNLQPAAGYALWQSQEYGDAHVTAQLEGTGTVIAAPGGVEAGKPLTIQYTEAAQDGITSVKLHYQVAGVQQPLLKLKQTDPVTGRAYRVPPTIHLPRDARGELSYWFEQTTRRGQMLRDGDSGRPYRLDLVPARGARVYFDREWSCSVAGELRAGCAARIDYDPNRIRDQIGDQWFKVENTLEIFAHVSFDGGRAFQQLPLTAYDKGHVLQTLELALQIPRGSERMTVYFSGSGIERSMIDSAFGQDYAFPVKPALP